MSRVATKGPPGQKPPKQDKPRRQPMRRVSTKRANRHKTDAGKEDLAHMGKVAALPCVICHKWNMMQTTRTEVHHCIHGRYSTARAPDTMTIPLCAEHHREGNDPDKIALHQEPSKWKRLYGEDTAWISWVEAQIGDDT